MDNIRGIAREIAPPVLMRMGFEEGLNELCSQLNNSKVMTVTFHKNVSIYNLSFQTQVQLYRIVQEIINNIIKHAGATSMQVNLKNSNDALITEIKHNGKGLTNEQVATLTAASKGIGLRSIKSRADVIRAKINYAVLGNNDSLTIIETPIDTNEKTN
jgi:signal transduction histidine kinase